jgi:hypothetical protein
MYLLADRTTSSIILNSSFDCSLILAASFSRLATAVGLRS